MRRPVSSRPASHEPPGNQDGPPFCSSNSEGRPGSTGRPGVSGRGPGNGSGRGRRARDSADGASQGCAQGGRARGSSRSSGPGDSRPGDDRSGLGQRNRIDPRSLVEAQSRLLSRDSGHQSRRHSPGHPRLCPCRPDPGPNRAGQRDPQSRRTADGRQRRPAGAVQARGQGDRAVRDQFDRRGRGPGRCGQPDRDRKARVRLWPDPGSLRGEVGPLHLRAAGGAEQPARRRGPARRHLRRSARPLGRRAGHHLWRRAGWRGRRHRADQRRRPAEAGGQHIHRSLRLDKVGLFATAGQSDRGRARPQPGRCEPVARFRSAATNCAHGPG